MERDFEALDELFDSIIEEIKHPELSAARHSTLEMSVDKNGLGFSEAVSIISVHIAEDKMSATVSVVSGGANPRPRSFDEIMKAIKAKGIVFGIDEEAVRSVSDGRLFDKSVVIARGKLPVDGKDGSLEHLYDCTRGKEIKNIDRETPVCRVIPPVMGTPGSDVTGGVLPAVDGAEAPNVAGENMALENGQVVTKASGTLAMRDGLYSIINEMIIDNDVNASMGIVSFAGTIIIRGNVRDKSVIRAGKSIIIMGYAFGAVIEAGADVSIAKNAENTVVIAQDGSVKGRDFIACAISAGTSIEAAAMLDCKVKAITGIECMNSGGSICGGEIECVGAVSCLMAGTRKREQTVINLGDTTEYVEIVKKNEKQLKHVQSELNKVNKRIAKLEKEKRSGDISLDDDNFLEAAVTITAQLKEEIKQAERKIENANRIISLSEHALLTVKMMLYSNVTVQIRGVSVTTETDYSDVTVASNNHGIVIT